MINETLRKNINVDKSNILPIFTFKEGDNAILKLALFKNSIEFDVTGQTLRLGAKTSKGLIEQLDGFTVDKNNIDIQLKNSILIPGVIEIDLEIKDAKGAMTTASFFITVNQKVLNDEAVEATNEFDTFTKTVDKIESDYTGLRRIIIDENQAASLQDQINNVNSSLDNMESLKATKQEVDIERKRINNFAKLGEGSTTGDAELIDGRVGVDGVVYDNIGDNIRNIAKGNGIKDNSIAPYKTDFLSYEDIMSQDGIVVGTLNSVGGVNSGNPGNTSDYIPVEEGMRIYIPGNIASMGYYNVNKTSLSSTLGRPSSLNNYKGVIPSNKDKVCYIRISWSNVEGNVNYRIPSEINIYKTDSIKFTKPLKDKSIPLSSIDYTFKDDYDNNIYFSWNSVVKTLYVYMKSSETNTYLGYRLRKMSASYDSSNSSSNYDIWRLRGIGLYTRNSDNTFNDILPDGLVHEASEWECAIKETGLSDFSGGSTHGDEFIDSIVFMLDGKIYNSYNDFVDKTCKEFRVIRKSKLYRANSNKETYIADHYVDYLFKNNEVIIDNRVDWKVDTNCGISYLCMLGAKRFNGTTQITNKALKQGDGTVLDVSTEGHSNNGTTKRCTKAYLWNDGSNGGVNVSMSVEILENNFFPNFNFKFDNRAEYNKFYFDQCGQNFNVKNGDIWFNKALYKIDYYGMY